MEADCTRVGGQGAPGAGVRRAPPTAILIERDGRIGFIHAGFEPEDEPRIEAAVRAALDREAPDGEDEPGAARLP